VAVLELVLVLPILLIPILAIIRFGLYYANMQQVALACRVGAEEASQTSELASTSTTTIPTNILQAVDRTLATAGITRCSVRLEHNASGTQKALYDPSSGGCVGGPTSNLSSPLPPGRYVRLTVCVPIQELVPRCLAGFGFGIADSSSVVPFTMVFRYELGL
jgi:Flp pilus assembly protein TadG